MKIMSKSFLYVFTSTIVLTIFLGLVTPFFLAPYAFYNGFPELTRFIPVILTMAAVIGTISVFTGITLLTQSRESRSNK